MRRLILPAVLSICLASTAFAAPGQLDTTFGSGGKVTIDFGGTSAVASAVALQPDGKIIVVGQTGTSSPASSDFAVARFTSAGQLDTTFGVGGKVVTDFLGGNDGATSVVLQPDGRILAGGFATGPSPFGGLGLSFAAVRYLSNGQLDATFGIGCDEHARGRSRQQPARRPGHPVRRLRPVALLEPLHVEPVTSCPCDASRGR